MFDLLTPGKKISLAASAVVAYLMLTAFVACLTEDLNNINWACWLGYYSILGFAVILLTGDLDLKNSKVDMARVATCVFAAATTIGLVTGVQVFTLVVAIFALAVSAAVIVFDYLDNQKINFVYCALAFAFLMLVIFFIIMMASRRPNPTVFLMTFDFPTAICAIAAGLNCYNILKEA